MFFLFGCYATSVTLHEVIMVRELSVNTETSVQVITLSFLVFIQRCSPLSRRIIALLSHVILNE